MSGSQLLPARSGVFNGWALEGTSSWFTVVPSQAGPLSITEFNVSPTLLLAVYEYTGNGPYDGFSVMGKGKGLNAQVTFDAKAKTAYYIQVAFSASPLPIVPRPATYSWDITATRSGTGIRFQYTGDPISPNSSLVYYNQTNIATASGTAFIIDPASSGVYGIGVVAQDGRISYMKWINVP